MLSTSCLFIVLMSWFMSPFLCLQQHHRALDDISLPSLHTHGDGIQSIIHRIKSAEIVNRLHHKYSERVRRESRHSCRVIMTCINVYVYKSVLPLSCLLSDAGLCSCRNAREAFSLQTAATGKHQAAACQCVCEFFYLPFSCYGNRLDLVDVALCSEKLPNKRGVCF